MRAPLVLPLSRLSVAAAVAIWPLYPSGVLSVKLERERQDWPQRTRRRCPTINVTLRQCARADKSQGISLLHGTHVPVTCIELETPKLQN